MCRGGAQCLLEWPFQLPVLFGWRFCLMAPILPAVDTRSDERSMTRILVSICSLRFFRTLFPATIGGMSLLRYAGRPDPEMEALCAVESCTRLSIQWISYPITLS
jgi:hypothetical protein